MEYPKKKQSFFKRPRRPPLFYRYPRLVNYSVMGLAGLILFSRPLYDTFFGPPGIPVEGLSVEEIRELRKKPYN